MDPKVKLLFAEKPWIESFNPLVSKSKWAHVERLDVAWMNCCIGEHYYGEYPWIEYGYFADEKGLPLGKVHPALIEGRVMNALGRVALECCGKRADRLERSIADATRALPHPDRVRFVVLVKQMRYGRDHITLNLLKLPNGKTLSMLLEEYDAAVGKKQQDEQDEAASEISAVLKS